MMIEAQALSIGTGPNGVEGALLVNGDAFEPDKMGRPDEDGDVHLASSQEAVRVRGDGS
jgi:hypothetical protein